MFHKWKQTFFEVFNLLFINTTQATFTQVCIHQYGLHSGIKVAQCGAELGAYHLLLNGVKKALKYIRRRNTE